MKAKHSGTTKDARVIVRLPQQDRDWLEEVAKETDSSVSRILRRGIRAMRNLVNEGKLSFDLAAVRPSSLAM